MKAIIKIYTTLINSGIKTIDDVPEKDRLDVETALADLYTVNEITETVETNDE